MPSAAGFNYYRGMAKYATGEPIYALATPFSPSALCVIRASGDGVLAIFQPHFTGDLLEARSGMAVHGFIIGTDGCRIDEAMVIRYSKGHGYTSEEAFEIMAHGSLPVIRAISSLLEERGMREAEKGEFTYRAFMHGRMDLTEAEAVEEIVKARTVRGSSEALGRLTGSIRSEAEDAKDAILDILASLEVQLDYGEDEIPEEWTFPSDQVDAIRRRLLSIAGKSSLYNALLKEERSIVSSVEGTTRDYIEAEAQIEGIPVRLFDTAGLRETGESVEAEGIRRTEGLMERADLIIYVLDPSSDDEPPEDPRVLPVWSRLDTAGRHDGISFSSVTGEGLEAVLDAAAEKLTRDLEELEDVPRIDSARQRRKLIEAADALSDAEKSMDFGSDVTAMYLQSALSSLGELTGEITGEDVLERLFSSFCLGK